MSQVGFKLHDWAGGQAEARCYSQAALSSNDSKTLYGGDVVKRFMNLVALQPLVVDEAFMPQMKAMDVPFHAIYGSLICFKGLQSDRPKC